MVSRHRDIELRDPPSLPEAKAGRSVIAVIGINEYMAWPRLSNAVSDALGALNMFKRLGFVELTTPLLDGVATGDAIRRLTTDDLAELSPDDSLVLFFAGHGHTITAQFRDASVKTGCVIPVDGSSQRARISASWLRLDSWLSDIARLPPRHILVFIDACYSGIALSSVDRWRDDSPLASGGIAALQARRSRRIITSALDDQRAIDGGPFPGHSLFTGCLIEGLSGGLAGSGQRVATGREIGQYLHQRVRSFPHSMQTPDVGAFELDDRGDIVVPLVAADAANAALSSMSAAPEPPHRTAELSVMANSRASLTRPNPARRMVVAIVAVAAIALVVVVVTLTGGSRNSHADDPTTPRRSITSDESVDATRAIDLETGRPALVPDAAAPVDSTPVELTAAQAGDAMHVPSQEHLTTSPPKDALTRSAGVRQATPSSPGPVPVPVRVRPSSSSPSEASKPHAADDADHDGIPDTVDKCPNEPETWNGYQDEDGCPDQIPQKLNQFTGAIGGIAFKVGDAVLQPSSYAALDKAVAVLKEFGDFKVEIQGHTDDQPIGPDGKFTDNLALSQARAEFVKAYLVSKGIDEARVTARGYGDTAPIENPKGLTGEKLSAARAANRRIEFKLGSGLTQ